MDQFIDKRDEQNHEPAAVAELRNPQRYRDDALRNVGKLPRLPGHDRGMPCEKADETNADEKRCDLDIMSHTVVEAVDQEADANHLAMLERMCEPEKGGCRHGPGDEIIARRDIYAERPGAGQQHHQHEKGKEGKPGEIAGEKVEPIKKYADHTVSFPLARRLLRKQ